MFKGCSALHQLALSPLVTRIGAEAFAGSGLLEVDLVRVTALGESCFAGSSLGKVHFGNDLSVLPRRGFAKTPLASVELVAAQKIDAQCFEGSALTQITFGRGLVEIGEGAFKGTRLVAVEIPQSVKELGSGIFENCAELTRAVLPEHTSLIPEQTFKGCRVMTQFACLPHAKRIGASAFSGCRSLPDPGLSEDVSVIGADAFRDCVKFSHLRLPDALVEIGTGAFRACAGLEGIEMGCRVSSWGREVFRGCGKKVTTLALRGPVSCENWSAQLIPALDPACVITRSGNPIEVVGQVSDDGNLVLKNLGDVRWYSVWRHRAAASAVFVVGSTRLVGASFCWAQKIRSISLNGLDPTAGRNEAKEVVSEVRMDELGAEGELGFASECTALTSLTLPPRLRVIGENACAGCAALSGVDLQQPLANLGPWCFSRCTVLGPISIPSGVTAIPDGAFEGSGLTEVTLCEGIKSIGKRGFANCKLTRVTLPETVTTLGDSAFDCVGLRTVSIGSGVASWGSAVFGNSRRIRTLDLRGEESCANWHPQIEQVLTEECQITINGQPACPFSGGVLALSGSRMIRWFNVHSARKFATSITIGSGVTLAPGVLANFTEVLDIDMTDSDLAELPGNGQVGLFRGCLKLRSCVLSSRLRTISPFSFAHCGALREVTIPDGVHRIGSSAFYQAGLEGVELPLSLRVIDGYAFAKAKVRTIAIPDGVETIGPSAFCQAKLECVALPPSLRVIGELAFAGTKLREVNIPDSVMQVGSKAFDCPLERVVIGAVGGRPEWGALCFGAGRRINVEFRGRDPQLIPSPLKDVALETRDEYGRLVGADLLPEVGHNETTGTTVFG